MSQSCLLFAGTYTETLPHVQGKAKGIYLLRLDSGSGALSVLGHTPGVKNPSYLAIAPSQRHLYAVQETLAGNEPAVHAFSLDPASGALDHLNQQPSHGVLPCHVSVSDNGNYVFVANYQDGVIAVYSIHADGRLGAASDIIRHHGSSVNPVRQQGPHAHCMFTAPDKRCVLSCDLGLDKIMIYRLEQTSGRLLAGDPAWVNTYPGAGPRHLAFHPRGRHVFVINELDASIIVYAYNDGALAPLQSISTLPAGYTGAPSGAAIKIAASGRFVYASNRGHDSIAIFGFDEIEGRLSLLGHESTQGKFPRDFAIDPSGDFLLVANQNSDTIVSLRIDPRSGGLSPTGQMAEVPTPVCLCFPALRSE